MTTKQIQGAVERVMAVADDAVLTPSQIVTIIKNKSIVPSNFSLYRFIKRGELKAVNLGTEDEPRYHVKGSALKTFFKKRYGNI